MFHHGFYAFFLILSFGFGGIVLLFGFLATKFIFKKPKKKPPKLKDITALIPKVTTEQEALDLIDKFFTHFSDLNKHTKKKDEWLQIIQDIAKLEFVDVDKAAEIREKLIKINPTFQKDISESIGLALKTKKPNPQG